LLGETFPVSFQLGAMAFGLALGLGVPLGVIAAARHNSPVDYAVRGLAMLGIALPGFVISVVLILHYPCTFNHWKLTASRPPR
jgi:ABC-type dipeptide/oligopeptide/nickel transport system permease component